MDQSSRFTAVIAVTPNNPDLPETKKILIDQLGEAYTVDIGLSNQNVTVLYKARGDIDISLQTNMVLRDLDKAAAEGNIDIKSLSVLVNYA